ncbi:sigma-70 family RNA polymerase sigma factor [Cyanobium sp. T1G-Tous]|uniref:sigma-70 family RNA polymerase sigma factor n=1 Tax=Cyanobium sp. T1G-Tous TaxID=2823722 RepID=UPI0020CCAEC0|nr:sigma-70 family RNA polymerase sigma factor [Cyanobium sp. T1G-Tous]MCP9802962.1 sigma-70 family RNA polymerase sigma factor [Cyanobium sp. T1G-Tous]
MASAFPATAHSKTSARQRRSGQADPAQAELGPSQLHTRNRSWLEAMAASPDATTKLWWRNALVEHNLALVRMVAQRQSQRTGQPFDELVSAGCLGLIRAVEAFDLRQTCNLSSYAVPYIRGAMLHDVRDHGQPLHTPRRLRELQQRARRLQEQRRGQGLAPLAAAEIASELGCSTAQLEEAGAVQRALQVRSLDAQLSDDGEQEGTLLDQLAAGSAAATCAGDDPGDGPDDDSGNDSVAGERALKAHWLQTQLSQLGGIEKRLLLGHWIEGLGWCELALELKLSSRQARQRGEALLAWLQKNAIASSAAIAV